MQLSRTLRPNPSFDEVTVEAVADETNFWGTLASEIQDDVAVANGKITGTLNYLDEGQLVNDWGEGYFLGLQFSNIDENATSVRVGLDPSEGSGLVEIINDPDLNGVFKITAKDTQKFKVVTSDGTNSNTQTFDLSELVLIPLAAD